MDNFPADAAGPLARTVLAWRRTALALVGLSLVAIKVIDWVSGPIGAALGFLSLGAAALVVGFAEQGVRQLTASAPRPVFALLSATAGVILILAVGGLYVAMTA